MKENTNSPDCHQARYHPYGKLPSKQVLEELTNDYPNVDLSKNPIKGNMGEVLQILFAMVIQETLNGQIPIPSEGQQYQTLHQSNTTPHLNAFSDNSSMHSPQSSQYTDYTEENSTMKEYISKGISSSTPAETIHNNSSETTPVIMEQEPTDLAVPSTSCAQLSPTTTTTSSVCCENTPPVVKSPVSEEPESE